MITPPTFSRFLLLFVWVSWLGMCPAQIDHYAIDEVVTLASNGFSLDVDGDNTADYTFEILSLAASPTATAARVISLGGSTVMDNSTFGYPDALDCGAAVTGPYSGGNAVLGTDVGGGGLFTGEGVKYLGLNIDIAGESHRGWIALEVNASNDMLDLHEVGYALAADAGIAAGQTGAPIEEPLCEFVYTIGTQTEIEIAVPTTGNVLPELAPLAVSTYAGALLLAEDSCFGAACTHIVFNAKGNDTITTCIDFMDVSNLSCPGDTLSCCLTQVWDAVTQSWQPVGDVSSISTFTVLPAVVFPVPAQDRLNVRGEFESGRIIDMSGRVVMMSGQSSVVDVSGIPEGVYLVEVMSPTARQVETIQIVR